MITVLNSDQLKTMTNWILEYSVNYMFGCPHSLLKYYVNLYYGKLGRLAEKERGGWKCSLWLILTSHQSLLMGKMTQERKARRNTQMVQEGADGHEGEGCFSSPVLFRGVKWHPVARGGLFWMMIRNRVTSCRIASVSLFLLEVEVLFEIIWFLLPNYSLCNYVLLASSTPAVSTECTNK